MFNGKPERLSQRELVALLAMMVATTAFSIDAMLPAFPAIAADLAPASPKSVQLIVAVFVVGMGLGTLFAGPLSDAYGRRPIAIWGAVLYILGALIAMMSPDLETILAARFLQGVGAAGPRIAAMAITRDLYSGRKMARITSFVMMIFAIVPIIAPTMGAMIASAFGWRLIFGSFVLFSLISTLWFMVRQSETLPQDARRPFVFAIIASGLMELLGNRRVTFAILAQSLIYTMLFTALMSSQPIFDEFFGRGGSFPFWFGLCAGLSATASLLNAIVVVRIGMQKVVVWSLASQICVSLVFLIALSMLSTNDALLFAVFFVWLISVFVMAGLGIGNLNALAMEPVGHIAGLAASIISAASIIVGAVLAAPVTMSFDGTPLPSLLGITGAALAALLLVCLIRREARARHLPN